MGNGNEARQAWIEQVIGQALRVLRTGVRADREIGSLAELCRDQDGRRQLVTTLQWMLLTAVREAWCRCWEPVDLIRYAGKRLSSGQRRLTTELAALQLQEYGAATLPPGWPGQLRELDAAVWWPADQSVLAVRATKDGWTKVLHDALAVLHLLDGLAPLERVGPLPGERRQGEPEAARDEVDPRILSRVRHLLAQAESTNFEAEAESFTAAAQSLMARHQIDQAMVEAARREVGGRAAHREVAVHRVGIENPYEAPKALLLNEVAVANRCRMVWNKEYGHGTVIGHATDRAAVELLFTSLLIQATRAMTAASRQLPRGGRNRTRAFRISFLTAFATRIGQRLESATQAEETTAAGRAGGGALVPVLAARKAAVDAAVEEIFPALQSHAIRSPTDGDGWRAGMSAADRAQLGATTPLEPHRDDEDIESPTPHWRTR